jgi:S1-C subfamily serine protease
MDHRVRWLLAVALMWASTAQAQVEPDTGPAIANSAPLNLWARVTALIAPPPGAQALATGTAFFVPSPDAQPRLMTVGHLVDGCLRIDLLSEELPTTRAELMSVTMAPEAAMLRVPQMPPAQPLPAMLAFRPLGDPPTTPGTKLTVVGFPAGADLLKPTVIEMTDITDNVPKPPKVRGYVLVQGEGASGFSGAPILNARGLVVAIFHGRIIDPEKAVSLMGAPLEHVSEGPTPMAINEGFFLKHPVGSMPVSSGTDDFAPEKARPAVVRVVCWRERMTR